MIIKNSILFLFTLIYTFGFSQNVDPFTGKMNYSVPVMAVPSKDGAAIPIVLSYSSGIGTNQQASIVGLGWNISGGGEISRSVIGAPDDYLNKEIRSTKASETTTSKYYGPIYYKDFPTNITQRMNSTYGPAMDISLSQAEVKDNQMKGQSFVSPAYDNYTMSSPFSGGALKLRHQEYGRLISEFSREEMYNYNKDKISFLTTFYDYQTEGNTPLNHGFTQKPIFTLENENYEAGEVFYPGRIQDNQYLNPSISPYYFTPPNTTNQQIQYKNGTYIEYYFNNEIVTKVLQGEILNAPELKGLYNSGGDVTPVPGDEHRRSGDQFDLNGIGAFKVVDVNGMTYHYSLPVYAKNVINVSFNLKEDYKPTITAQGDLYGDGSGIGYEYDSKSEKYASSWKLTAITGQNYEDANGNGIADSGDRGYWVAYHYDLYNNDYAELQTPSQGYTINRLNAFHKPNSASYLSSYGVNKQADAKIGSVSKFTTQIYYLTKIETASHEAHFIMEERKDYLHRPKGVYNINEDVKGKKLSKIILVRNGNDPTITTNIISSVDFNQDYSLAKGYYNSQHTGFSSSPVQIMNNYFLTDILNFETTSNFEFNIVSESSIQRLTNSGKLTLNSIIINSNNENQISPSLDFEYGDKLSVTENPNYSPEKYDEWGMYKSDFDLNNFERFTSNTSKDYVDAWSLKKIISPLEGITEIVYETNYYEKVGKDRAVKRFDILDAVPTSFDPVNGTLNNWTITLKPEVLSWLNSPMINNNNTTVTFDILFDPEDDNNLYCGNIDQSTADPNRTCTGPRNMVSINRFALTGNINNTDLVDVEFEYSKELEECNHAYFACTSLADFAYGPFISGHIIVEHQNTTVPGGGIRVKEIKRYKKDLSLINKTKFSHYQGNATYEPHDFSVLIDGGDRSVSTLPTPITPTLQRPNYVEPSIKQAYNEYGGMSAFYSGPMIGYAQCDIEVFNASETESNGVVSMYYDNVKRLDELNLNNSVTYREYIVTTYDTINRDLAGHVYQLSDSIVLKEHKRAITKIDNQLDTRYGRILRKEIKDRAGFVTGYEDYEYFEGDEENYTGAMQEIYYTKNHTFGPSLATKGKRINVGGGNAFFGPDGPARVKVADAAFKISVTYIVPEEKHYITDETIFIKNTYPSILKRKTIYKDGSKTVFENLEFDKYTGIITLSKSTTEEGIDFSKVILAYTQYPDLKPKSENTNNKNILTGTAGSIEYNPKISTVDNNYTLSTDDITSYIVSTYKNSWDIRQYNSTTNEYEFGLDSRNYWRSYKTYVWKRDKNIPFIDFDWSATAQNENWRRVMTAEKLNENGALMQTQGIENISSAKMGYNNQFTITGCANCKHDEFTFSSAEFDEGNGYVEGEVKVGGTLSTTYAHSGNNSIELVNNTEGFVYEAEIGKDIDINRKYHARVWMHKSDLEDAFYGELFYAIRDANGSTIFTTSINSNHPSVEEFGDWRLLALDIDIPSTANQYLLTVGVKGTSSGNTVYADDFKFQPLNVATTGVVYDEKTGRIESTLDDHNLSTSYVYEDNGSIKEVWVEEKGVGKHKAVETKFNYSK